MAKFSEMSLGAQVGIILVLAIGLTVAGYMLLYKGMKAENEALEAQVKVLEQENARLASFEQMMPQLERTIAELEQQLERQKMIVPDEKEADRFIQLMQQMAGNSGITIRRYTARPSATREFYVEVPFDVQLDGPYYAVLDFFQRVAKMDRIVNIGNLAMATVETPAKVKAKHTYQYSPSDTVVATAVATTFFSTDAPAPPPPAAAGKPGAAGRPAAAAPAGQKR